MPNESPGQSPDDAPRGRRLGANAPIGRVGDGNARLSVPEEDIPVDALLQNVNQVVVRVTHDKLQGHLESYARGVEYKSGIRLALLEALAFLGVALALGVPLFSATFSDFWIVPAETLRPTCGVLSFVFMIATVERVARAIAKRMTGTQDHVSVSAAVDAIEQQRDFPASS